MYMQLFTILQMSVVKPMYASVMLTVILEKNSFKRKKIRCGTVIPLIKKQTN